MNKWSLICSTFRHYKSPPFHSVIRIHLISLSHHILVILPSHFSSMEQMLMFIGSCSVSRPHCMVAIILQSSVVFLGLSRPDYGNATLVGMSHGAQMLMYQHLLQRPQSRRGSHFGGIIRPHLVSKWPQVTASRQLGSWNQHDLTRRGKTQPTSDFKSTSDKSKSTAKSKKKSFTFSDLIDSNEDLFMQLVVGSNITHPISLSWCRYAHRLTLY